MMRGRYYKLTKIRGPFFSGLISERIFSTNIGEILEEKRYNTKFIKRRELIFDNKLIKKFERQHISFEYKPIKK